MHKKMTSEFTKYQKEVDELAAFLQQQFPIPPQLIIITGTGQGKLPKDFIIEQEISYTDLPNFPQATAPGHNGKLIYGVIAKKQAVVLQGRFHYYEGYSGREITIGIRVLALLGAKVLIIGNTAGGLNSEFNSGQIMLIDDHLNLMGVNPLRGLNNDNWGLRFPDMSQVYSINLRDKAVAAARHLNTPLKHGVYAGVAGPSLETPAETRFLKLCGADAVGMSTIPEVIVAKHAGMEVLGLTIIANVNDPDNFQPIILEEVIAQVKEAEDTFMSLINEVINRLQIQ